MGGLGKTSLSQMVYNDESIEKHFELRMWVCISNYFDVHKILKEIIEAITNTKYDDPSNVNVLVIQLKEKLIGKKYLLVLDDLWNEDVGDWEKLKSFLATGAEGSKILVTTRNQNVASIVRGLFPPYSLQKLPDDVCWSIIETKAFSIGGAFRTPHMVAIGKKIAEKCNGLPLAAKSIGSLMHSKSDESSWLSIASNDHMWDTPDLMAGSSYCLPNLVELQLWECHSCEQLPALGLLPCLRDLYIKGMNSVKCLGKEFYNQQESTETEESSSGITATKMSALFPSLIKFSLQGMENLLEWVSAPPHYNSFPCLEKLDITNCKRLIIVPNSLPSLKVLALWNISMKAVRSMFASAKAEAGVVVGIGGLTSLTSISIRNSPELIYFPLDVLQNNTHLQSLRILGCSDFQCFCDDLNNKHDETRKSDCPAFISSNNISRNSLRKLELTRCPVLRVLPDLQSWTSLRILIIRKCGHQLKESIPYDLKSLTFLEELSVDFMTEKN